MNSFITLDGFKRPGKGGASDLGPLEREVMELIWRRPKRAAEVSVRDIHLAFNERLAYTTLMTTLDRLHKKGLNECRSEEHTSELQSLTNLVCRLLLEKKKKIETNMSS